MMSDPFVSSAPDAEFQVATSAPDAEADFQASESASEYQAPETPEPKSQRKSAKGRKLMRWNRKSHTSE